MAFTTIDNPELYFQTKIFTGTGSSNAVTLDGDENMQPDMVWIKHRGATYNHVITDAVRGVTKEIYPNTNGSEVTNANGLTAFGSDGFTVGSDAGYNASSGAIVAWCWKAGTTSGINASGADITPSAYSFSQTAGISIINYSGNGTSGAKIAHGLGAKPHFIVCMNRATNENRMTFHHKNSSAPETDYLLLNTTAAGTDAARWNDALPGTVYFEVDDNDAANKSGDNIVGYCFTSIQGYSKFGSYTGNANADGPFVYTGFKPALVCVKITSASGEAWNVVDNKRAGGGGAGGNPNGNILLWSGTDADYASGSYQYAYVDMLSNGFKIRTSANQMNKSGQNFIFMAWAESPFCTSSGVPNNAN